MNTIEYNFDSMTKTSKEHKTGSESQGKACFLCRKVYKNVIQLCTYCEKKLKAASAPNASVIDGGLINAFNQKRAVDKTKCVQNLVRELSTDKSESRVTMDELRKRNKALEAKLRRQATKKSTTAALGFKEKGAKSAAKSLTD